MGTDSGALSRAEISTVLYLPGSGSHAPSVRLHERVWQRVPIGTVRRLAHIPTPGGEAP